MVFDYHLIILKLQRRRKKKDKEFELGSIRMLQRCDAIIRFLCKDYKYEHKLEKHDKEY